MRVTLLAVALIVATVGAVTTEANPIEDAVMKSEMAALARAKDTVKAAQTSLNNVDDDQQEAVVVRKTSVVKEAKALDKNPLAGPSLGDALMTEDDETPENLGESAEVGAQAQAVQQDMAAASEAEGEEHAGEKDIKKTFDLAKSMRASDLLPEGWVEKYDAGAGKNYYENSASGKTSWDPPRSLVSIAMTAAQGQLQMKKQMEKMEMKMKEMSSENDLGESGGVGVSQCASAKAKLTEMSAVAKKLHATVHSLSAKLNLTGEQQKMLAKLLKTHAVPELPAGLSQAKAVSKKITAKAKKMKKSIKKEKDHPDLGESDEDIEHQKPVELQEAVALMRNDDNLESKRVAAAMQAEATRVSDQFHENEKERAEVVRKASLEAAAAVDKKMAAEDEALFTSDKDADDSMDQIISDQKNLENEQAMFRGTMTPQQVNQVLDPEIADMEKADLTSDDDFTPVEFKRKR